MLRDRCSFRDTWRPFEFAHHRRRPFESDHPPRRPALHTIQRLVFLVLINAIGIDGDPVNAMFRVAPRLDRQWPRAVRTRGSAWQVATPTPHAFGHAESVARRRSWI